MIYKLTNTNPNVILRNPGADQSIIPKDPANIDYQEYLAWLEKEGNEVLPADDIDPFK
jgi:hypothetical protein